MQWYRNSAGFFWGVFFNIFCSCWPPPTIDSRRQAYKRNPMRSERLCSLGRYLRNKPKEALDTYAAQWLERSLDDSAIRRISIPESYLCADACLLLLLNISDGLVVYEQVIKRRIEDELPFVRRRNHRGSPPLPLHVKTGSSR